MIEKRVLGFASDPDFGVVPHTVVMKFNPAAPVEVRFGFGPDNEWVFAKDLLVIGAVTPIGEGDVRFAPREGELVWMQMWSGTHRMDVDLPLFDVLDFLNSVATEVQQVDEEAVIRHDLDQWLIRELGVTE